MRDWGSELQAEGWTYERLLELDEAVVKKGGLPASKVSALPRVEFNPGRAASEARAAAAEARARSGEAEPGPEAVGEGGDERVANMARMAAVERLAAVPAKDPKSNGTGTAAAVAPRFAGCPGEDCAVCLTDFIVGDMLIRLPPCGHLFHGPCLQPWLKNHRHCPKCRATLCEEEEHTAHSGGEGEDQEEPGSPLAGSAIGFF